MKRAIALAVAVIGCGRAQAPAPAPRAEASAFDACVARDAPQSSDLREELLAVPLGGLRLEATLYLPASAGPSPLVVLSHGSPRDPHARQGRRKRYVAQSRWFLERGYAVLIPMRRGYACSEGEWAESFGACADPDYFGAGRTTADDIRAAIDHVARRPEVDPRRIVLVGQSAGGFGSLALASTKPSGVVAVINFAGGRGSRKSGQVCAEDRLVDAVRRYGASVEVPTLWLYSENDGFFAPALARAMFDAFAAKKSTFVALPAFHTDGHEVFSSSAGVPLWRDRVDAFLGELGLPRG